jgi:7-cyano-7-deazaguanine reductase
MTSNKLPKQDLEIPKMVRGEITQLGTGSTNYPTRPGEAVLEAFSNVWLQDPFLVELECPEFTSLCPKTKQPDFASITIRYVPDKWMVESKSLKLYMFSYRNFGCFHEFIINKIARDLFDLMLPHGIVVRGDFYSRGGISINPVVEVIAPNLDILLPNTYKRTKEMLWSK